MLPSNIYKLRTMIHITTSPSYNEKKDGVKVWIANRGVKKLIAGFDILKKQ